MRHENNAARVILQEALEPGDGFRIEVVGRLVEQQDVGFRQQETRQSHAALFTARELRHVGIARWAAQRIEGLLDLRVEVPQVQRVDLILQRRHFVGGLFRIVRGDLVVPVEDGLLFRHAFHGIAEHVLGGIEFRLLRQISDLDAISGARFADEVVRDAGHDLEQRGFARTVQTHDADFCAGEEGERDVLQHLLAARIGLGQLVHVVDVLVGCGHRGRLVISKLRDVAGLLADWPGGHNVGAMGVWAQHRSPVILACRCPTAADRRPHQTFATPVKK